MRMQSARTRSNQHWKFLFAKYCRTKQGLEPENCFRSDLRASNLAKCSHFPGEACPHTPLDTKCFVCRLGPHHHKIAFYGSGEGWWLHVCHGSVAEHWWLWSQRCPVWFPQLLAFHFPLFLLHNIYFPLHSSLFCFFCKYFLGCFEQLFEANYWPIGMYRNVLPGIKMKDKLLCTFLVQIVIIK